MIMAHRFGWVGWSEYWGLCPLLDALHILIITMKITCCNAMMKNKFYVRANCNGNDEGYGNICIARPSLMFSLLACVREAQSS